MSELSFQYAAGGLFFPSLCLWMDAPKSVGPEAAVVVSHAHSDHIGKHAEIVVSPATQQLMRVRVPGKRRENILSFGETHRLKDLLSFPLESEARVTLLPAGHILGSSMALLESGDDSLLYTGDFKLRQGLSAETCRPCHARVLVMETTFGRPEYLFPPSQAIHRGVREFCREALDHQETPVLLGYSLGKAQEALLGWRDAGIPVAISPSMVRLTEVYEGFGFRFPEYSEWDGNPLNGKLLIAPPGGSIAEIRRKLGACRIAVLTGWAVRPGCQYQYRADAAFPMSDHADFAELLEFVRAVAPEKVYTLHGFAADFAQYLKEHGFDAAPLSEPEQLELALIGSRRAFHSVRPIWTPEGRSSINDSSQSVPVENRPDTFRCFATTCHDIRCIYEKTRKIPRLTEYLRQIDPIFLNTVKAWLSGFPLPNQTPRAFAFEPMLLKRSVMQLTGMNELEFRQIQLCHGHIALAIAEVIGHWRTSESPGSSPADDPLLLNEVLDTLLGIHSAAGAAERQIMLVDCLARCTAMEALSWVRIMSGDLRIGLDREAVEGAFAELPPNGGSNGILLEP